MTTLYLTTAERALYDVLPASVKSAWNGTVEEEKGTAWESDEELEERIVTFSEEATPELKQFVEKIQQKLKNKENPDDLNFSDIPEKLIPTILFVIGARGLSQMLEGLLRQENVALSGAAVFSEARHLLLESNAAYMYV
ncbi:MAG: hypothetical protein HOO67_02765 [Candidatus Peribacteraceae bacterium]|nr:hypothetical protein [Candidatus Peribacteraceae bacterium]